MPDRVEVQNLTCAAGVSAAAPTEVILNNVVACQVVRVTIRIPPGHAGLTGIALGYGHIAVLPRTAGAYISGDDEIIAYDLSDYIAGPQWQAFLINGDAQPHPWQVRFEVNELVGALPVGPPGVLTPEEIQAAGAAVVGVA